MHDDHEKDDTSGDDAARVEASRAKDAARPAEDGSTTGGDDTPVDNPSGG